MKEMIDCTTTTNPAASSAVTPHEIRRLAISDFRGKSLMLVHISGALKKETAPPPAYWKREKDVDIQLVPK
jgi:hypothetical protein